MDIEFVWSSAIRTVPRDGLESKVREDIERDPSIIKCHPGKVTVHVSSTDPLEVHAAGNVVCQCGKDLANFSGAINGSFVNWFKAA
jgi:hypothetical protein